MTYELTLKIAEKKKKLKKDGKGEETIPEDNPDKYKHAIYVMVMKVCCHKFTCSCVFCHFQFYSFLLTWKGVDSS